MPKGGTGIQNKAMRRSRVKEVEIKVLNVGALPSSSYPKLVIFNEAGNEIRKGGYSIQ